MDDQGFAGQLASARDASPSDGGVVSMNPTESSLLNKLDESAAGTVLTDIGTAPSETESQLILMEKYLKKQHYVATRSMQPKKRNRDRQWKTRPKVSSNLSKDFPWEVVLRFLKDHPRSLILLQMVDKNLYNLISTDNKMWLSIFRREIKHTAYCIRTIQDPVYPNLRLWKPALNGIPVYVGPLRGDPDESKLPFGFDVSFSSYVRRTFALKHGTRCGLCGCRHRHDLYWSLRMRVCRLCMENNSISGEALSRKYGIDYSDMLVKHKGQVFFYSCNIASGEDRVSMHSMTRADIGVKSTTYMFWLPHLRSFLDLPALYQQQAARRRAAVVLSNAVKRRWGTLQRNIFATKKAHYSIDCLLLVLYRNEKKRFTHPYGVASITGGPAWAFSECPRSGHSKITLRNGFNIAQFYRLLVDYEDCIV